MSAAYITAVDVDAFIGQATRSALFNDGNGFTTSTFLKVVYNASSLVKAAAHAAGYTSLGDTTTNDTIKTATLGQFLVMAYNRKQQRVPAEFYEQINLTSEIREGRVPIPGMSPSTQDAVGGVSFSETSTSVSGARYNVFSRGRLDVY